MAELQIIHIAFNKSTDFTYTFLPFKSPIISCRYICKEIIDELYADISVCMHFFMIQEPFAIEYPLADVLVNVVFISCNIGSLFIDLQMCKVNDVIQFN